MADIKKLTDQEIVQGLIARDNRITHEFFFKKCRPLFVSIIDYVFSYHVDYDEVIAEIYMLLMKDGEKKLRGFDFHSTLYTWLKVVAIRHLIEKRDNFVANESKETYLAEDGGSRMDDIAGGDDESWTGDLGDDPGTGGEGGMSAEDTHSATQARIDVARLIGAMPNERYAMVIRRSMLDEIPDNELAEEMGIKVSNLYNIKRRAMEQLTEVAKKDIRYYGKKK